MKILLRDWDGDYFVWKDAKYTNQGFVVNGYDGCTVHESNVVSTFKDNRAAYVKCSRCGAIFRKGSKKWEKHITPTTDATKCFNCRHLYINDVVTKGQKFRLLEDGKYAVSQRYDAHLLCKSRRNYYSYPDINSEAARQNCVYNECVGAEAKAIEDFFTKYPGAFDDLITIDKIVDAEFKDVNDHYDGSRSYRLKFKNNIWAHMTTNNIVNFFSLNYRGEYYVLYYSKKYNKVFYNYSNKYREWNPVNMPTETKQRIMNKLASLYE